MEDKTDNKQPTPICEEQTFIFFPTIVVCLVGSLKTGLTNQELPCSTRVTATDAAILGRQIWVFLLFFEGVLKMT